MTIEEFKNNIEISLENFKQEHAIYFSWLCGLRILPFFGIESNFNYWGSDSWDIEKKEKKQKHLESIFTALDIAYVASAVYYVDSYTYKTISRSDVVSAANDVMDSVVSNIVKSAIKTIREIANVIHSEGYKYDYVNFYCTFGEGPYKMVLSSAIDTAVAAAKTFSLIGLLDEYYNIALNDIESIKNNNLNALNTDISIYGNLWDDFLLGLRNNGCEYWAKMYSELFSKCFTVNNYDLQERIKLFEIRNEGAAGIGKFMHNKTTVLQLPTQTKTNVFLSYCSKENDLADIIDNTFSIVSFISVSRYIREVGYRESIKEFMKKINKHDFVIMLISDNFLKSQPCMFEVSELLADNEFMKKLLFIIVSDEDCKYIKSKQSANIGAKIYKSINSIEYIKYWENEYYILEKSLDNIISITAKIEPLEQLREIKRIIDHDLSPFIKYLNEHRGKSFSEFYENNFEELISIIYKFRKANNK